MIEYWQCFALAPASKLGLVGIDEDGQGWDYPAIFLENCLSSQEEKCSLQDR